ncbi:MAG TPA: Stp1/IreP family PP2C-type Ser/Thr phosphatase [Blastocatellia bacterium]|nr:Stp1/IreP family PP2C-type Ser/Thr phosphatase [Blastocatellia bacterium]
MSTSSDVTISVFARTDTGMRRPGNEDAFLVADLTTGNVGLGPDMSTHRVGERGSLLVVSDGLGGAAAGEVASEMAVKTIRQALLDLPSDTAVPERMKRAAEIANENIWNAAQQNPNLAGMGATLTAVLVDRASALISQVGDSRAYIIRGDRIKQITKDQSLVQLLMESGAIRPDQAANVPQNVIMQALGTSPVVQVAITSVQLFRNDYLLLCSDGLSNKVQTEEMKQVVQTSMDLAAGCRRLVEMANERGGEDNITVIIARFDGEALYSAAESTNNTITGSFEILSEFSLSDSQLDATSQYSTPAPAEPIQATTLVLSSFPELEDEQPATAPVTVKQPLPEVSTAAPGLRPQAIASQPPSRTGIYIVGLLVAVLLGLLGFLGYRYYKKQKGGQPTTPPVSQPQTPASQ